MDQIISAIRKELNENADENTRLSGERFFKEKVKLYGLKTAATKIAKETFKTIKNQPKQQIWDLCETLWKSGYMEETFIASSWAFNLHSQYEENDFTVFENWVNRYVSNWASCDTLCNHTVGTFIEKFPAYIANLKEWAKSPNLWMRRASAVTLILPAKKGKFLEELFEIADLLLTDREDLVQKGYGWLLKAACEKHEKEVFHYVMSKKQVMPRTSLRYAIEKMPKELKTAAMQK